MKRFLLFHNLLENYRKVIDETRESSSSLQIPTKSNSNSLDSSRSDDFVFVNTKVERLEYEKIMMYNEIIEMKREITGLNLEKSIQDYKLNEMENIYNLNNSKLKDAILILEKK